MKYNYLLPAFFVFITTHVLPQVNRKTDLVFADKNGVLRYTKDKTEAAFFGVNYTVPFAYGYRSVKRAGVTIEKEIDEDVYHFSRLGLDAFRVHVWDTEISDSTGNLLENDHLRLFDYLLLKLKERNIKVLITPIAFWGNGYPEQDEKTGSFSNVYGKQQAVVNENAIKAQEKYLQQLFTHVNPYTHLAFKDDPNIIATELNNEPHHSGPKEKTTEYINRLAAAVKSSGWTKPIFYNISESPDYAGAVAAANVDGHSFQWYPTGLVSNHTLQGNYLPNIDRYSIPFDTIPAFRKRVKAIYEFDAGDVLQSDMYPAMARSFRAAGFQWATQFAYDPLATAHANTEYQTHYLNLAYTPSKAISLLIACKAFHRLPRLKSYGTYPADSVFDVFRVSYREQLSEMNSPEEFYYSNSTGSAAVNVNSLRHVAGVGSSSVVKYKGFGAYFLDKLDETSWRLEVMPDAIHIRDPFERASPLKEVTRIQWARQSIEVALPGLGSDFTITALDSGNNFSAKASENTFGITPGTYILSATSNKQAKNAAVSASKEFIAPGPFDTGIFVVHQPVPEVSANTSFAISALITGLDSADKVTAEIRTSSNKWSTVQLQALSAYDFRADVAADMVTPGVLAYRLIIQKPGNEFVVFPGNHKGNPHAWDAYENDWWQTFVAAGNTGLELFNATNDRDKFQVYNTSWRNNSVEYITSERPGQLLLKATMAGETNGVFLGLQQYIGNKLAGRQSELSTFSKMTVRAKFSAAGSAGIIVAFITKDGATFAAHVPVTNAITDIDIPLTDLKPDSVLLLPRPYPGFEPLMFYSASQTKFNLQEADKMQIIFRKESEAAAVELESVLLKK